MSGRIGSLNIVPGIKRVESRKAGSISLYSSLSDTNAAYKKPRVINFAVVFASVAKASPLCDGEMPRPVATLYITLTACRYAPKNGMVWRSTCTTPLLPERL